MSRFRQLPLFPLPLVLFPHSLLPLHIFEPRYRAMVNEVLEGDRLFGIIFCDGPSKGSVDVGCSARILDVEKLHDGRMNIMTQGEKRFRVIDHVQRHPYMISTVELIDDTPSETDLKHLASGVRELVNDVVRLSEKLADRKALLPFEVPNAPDELSFWIASNLYRQPSDQQNLLELQDTARRLGQEQELLSMTCKHLAARTALKDAFR